MWRPAELSRLVWAVLPLGLTTFLVSLNSNIPRYFIEHWVGRDGLGYFAAIAYFVFAAQLVIGSLSRAASPRLAILYRDDRTRYGALLGKLVVIGVAMGAFGVLAAVIAGEPFLRLVYNPEYAERNHLLVLLMAAGGIMFVNAFFGMAISAARFFAVQTVTYVVVALTTVTACALLIPRWGLEGAAWSAIASATVNTTINGAVVVYVYRHIDTRVPGQDA
jgi:O-antigen/teichoic acid export membrane protein